MSPVAGKVTQGGKAFTKKGTVTFYPDKSKKNESTQVATGELSESGEFSLKTGGKDGAPLGWYKVAVVSQAPPNPKEPYGIPKNYIDAKYGTEATTPLQIEVKEGAGPDAYVIPIP